MGNKMMNRLNRFSVALLLLIGMLGCGRDSDEQTAEPVAATTPSEAQVVDDFRDFATRFNAILMQECREGWVDWTNEDGTVMRKSFMNEAKPVLDVSRTDSLTTPFIGTMTSRSAVGYVRDGTTLASANTFRATFTFKFKDDAWNLSGAEADDLYLEASYEKKANLLVGGSAGRDFIRKAIRIAAAKASAKP